MFSMIRKVTEDEKTRRNRKIMSSIIASGSLSLWYNSPVILWTLKITLPFLHRLLPFLFFFLLFPPATIPSRPTETTPRTKEEGERGEVLLDRVFLFSLHPPARSPFIFKSPPPSPVAPSPRGLTVRSAFVSSALYVGLLKNFTLTFMLERNLQHGGWNFLRKLYGAYWNQFYKISQIYIVIFIISVLIAIFLSTLFKDISIKRKIRFFYFYILCIDLMMA